MTFYSEYGQDRWLVKNVLGDRRDGIFVEAGALDGLIDSNTLFLARERGWRGVLIEGNPMLLDRLEENRPDATVVGCALASADGLADFRVVSGCVGWSGLVSTLDEGRFVPAGVTVKVITRPLADVLRQCRVTSVDYLSLDLEGAELDVLSVFPFAEIPIRVIGVEDNNADNHALRQLLTRHGYTHIARIGVDEFWIHHRG